MGIKPTFDTDGNIMVKQQDGTQVPLQVFHKGLAEIDTIQQRFNETFGGGETQGVDIENNPTAAWMDNDRLLEKIPEENRAQIVKAFEPMMSDPRLMDNKHKRTSLTKIITKIIDYANIYEDPNIQYKAMKKWAENEDLDLEMVYDYLPESIKLPIGYAMTDETKKKIAADLKSAAKREKIKKERAKASARRQKTIIQARKGVPSGFGF
jgi:hypothetical protein